ncbi:MAG TPA: rhomboid family intramembrane serine protease [Desulfobacterales bacterium]|nr:rhomboid family intramembrane serine protease [Desulfobacterales bacterium]
MFPLRDDIPARLFPVVNTWIIVVNVLCYGYQLALGPGGERLIFQYGFVPARLLFSPAFLGFDPTELPTLLSYMFLHGGFLHLAGNMWMLWVFGDNVEDAMGHGRYLLFYLACGVVSALAQMAVAPASGIPMVGASGAISGVLGAYFLLYPAARILTLVPIFFFLTTVEVPAFVFLVLWFVLQFLQGAASLRASGAGGGVAWWAHIGGFIAGMALLPLARKRRPRRRRLLL